MMNMLDFSRQLRELSDDYANQRILLEDYRAQRKVVLDEIDLIKNGVDIHNQNMNSQEPDTLIDSDQTNQYSKNENSDKIKISGSVVRLIGLLKKADD